jgi:hypothetical protein
MWDFATKKAVMFSVAPGGRLVWESAARRTVIWGADRGAVCNVDFQKGSGGRGAVCCRVVRGWDEVAPGAPALRIRGRRSKPKPILLT